MTANKHQLSTYPLCVAALLVSIALGLEVRNAQHSLLLYASERADYVDWRTKLLHYARRTWPLSD